MNFPDLAFVPLSMIPVAEEIMKRDQGLAGLNNEIFVTLEALSDAGQKHWPVIAAFAEQRAAALDEEAAGTV